MYRKRADDHNGRLGPEESIEVSAEHKFFADRIFGNQLAALSMAAISVRLATFMDGRIVLESERNGTAKRVAPL